MPSRSTDSSKTCLLSSAIASFATDPSGPGVPTWRIWLARRFVRRATSDGHPQAHEPVALGTGPLSGLEDLDRFVDRSPAARGRRRHRSRRARS